LEWKWGGGRLEQFNCGRHRKTCMDVIGSAREKYQDSFKHGNTVD